MLRRCINRNIVECKVVSVRLISFCSPRINRNIVECKECCWIFQFAFAIWVLIETLWNVKQVTAQLTKYASTVLIETLWNVKADYTWSRFRGVDGY